MILLISFFSSNTLALQVGGTTGGNCGSVFCNLTDDIIYWGNLMNIPTGLAYNNINNAFTVAQTMLSNLTVDNNLYVTGNVGIGTTNPTAPLYVKGAGSYISRFESTNTNNWNTFKTSNAMGEYGIYNGNLYFQGTSGNLGIKFFTQGSPTGLQLLNGGNVGIGTSNPVNKLNVIGDINATSNIRTDGNLYAGTNMIIYTDADGNVWISDGS